MLFVVRFKTLSDLTIGKVVSSVVTSILQTMGFELLWNQSSESHLTNTFSIRNYLIDCYTILTLLVTPTLKCTYVIASTFQTCCHCIGCAHKDYAQ